MQLFSSLRSGGQWATSSLEEIYESFTWEDFENLVALVFIVLFWIGGARIVSSLASKIYNSSPSNSSHCKKTYSCDE